jgi:hypothetical protein
MKLMNLFLAALLTFALSGHAQNSRLYPPVKTTTKVKVPGTIFGAPKCDASGNIYVRAGDGKRKAPAPVYEIAPDGSVVRSFDPFEVSPDLTALPFFATGDGRVYMGAWDPDYGVYVVSFAHNSAGQKLRLDSDYFLPYHIAVFSTGEILLSGVAGPRNRDIYTAVFATTGKLLKKIQEPEDENARLKAEAGEHAYAPESTPGYGNDFAIRGDTALGSDGNVYLLRSTGLIYVISHTGEVLRKMKIPPPQPGMIAYALKATQDRLAVVFLNRGKTVGTIQIVDYTGKAMGTYEDPTTATALLGCYVSEGDSEGFAFAGFQDGKIAITRFKH